MKILFAFLSHLCVDQIDQFTKSFKCVREEHGMSKDLKGLIYDFQVEGAGYDLRSGSEGPLKQFFLSEGASLIALHSVGFLQVSTMWQVTNSVPTIEQ